MTQGDLDRLYERRQRIERDVQRALDDAMAYVPIEPEKYRGDLHLVARPVVPQADLRIRMLGDDDGGGLRQAVLDATNGLHFTSVSFPEFAGVVSGSYARQTADGVAIESAPTVNPGQEPINDNVSRLELLDEGTVRLFQARVAHVIKRRADGDAWIVRESGVAQYCTHFVRMVGQLLAKANYSGQVDLLFSLTGAKGAVSGNWFFDQLAFFTTSPLPTIRSDDFRHHVRTSAQEMLDNPAGVATALESRLARLIRPQNMPDPLQLT